MRPLESERGLHAARLAVSGREQEDPSKRARMPEVREAGRKKADEEAYCFELK